jgi:FMN phosphatase YigB (HAD superfamily)
VKPSRKTSRPAPSPAPRIEIVIFDLDDTLYDCFGQRVLLAHRYASQAMVAAGVRAGVEEILRARMEAFRSNPHLDHIDAEVCRRFRVPDPQAVMAIARAAYFSCPVGALKLFPGARRLLRALRRRGVRNFIVSFGDPQTQAAKVKALGLRAEPAVEDILYADAGLAATKEAPFASILQRTQAEPDRVLVVGDRPGGEIRAGRKLGMHTVRLRHGEFSAIEPVGHEEQADFEIARLDALLQLPYRFGPARMSTEPAEP